MTPEHLLLPSRRTRSIGRFLEVRFWSDIRVTRLAAGEEDRLPSGAALTEELLFNRVAVFTLSRPALPVPVILINFARTL